MSYLEQALASCDCFGRGVGSLPVRHRAVVADAGILRPRVASWHLWLHAPVTREDSAGIEAILGRQDSCLVEAE